MLIALYLFIVNVVLPQIAFYAQALFQPVLVIIITFVGIVILLGAVGMRVSNNLGSTVVNGIFGAIGYIFQSIVRAIGWVVRSTFRLIPRVFNGSRQTFISSGMNALVSNLLAALISVVVLAVII